MNRDQFWTMVDMEQASAARRARARLRPLTTCSLPTLRLAMAEYRWFTIYYVSDLAYLVYRLPGGLMRTTLGEILAEELGSGDLEHEHPRTYDNFLLTLGVDSATMQASLPDDNRALLEGIRHEVQGESSLANAIGLRGMGGECLCQSQLIEFYRAFASNPAIIARREQIDWEFWKVHTGAEEDHHKQILREAIDDMIQADPSIIDDLAAGYMAAKDSFDSFWSRIIDHVTEAEAKEDTAVPVIAARDPLPGALAWPAAEHPS